MHQFVVKLTAVTSLNRMLQGLEPFTETACVHDSAVVPFDYDSYCLPAVLFTLFFYNHFIHFIHLLVFYELCGNLRGRPNNLKEHLLVNKQPSEAVPSGSMGPTPMGHQAHQGPTALPPGCQPGPMVPQCMGQFALPG